MKKSSSSEHSTESPNSSSGGVKGEKEDNDKEITEQIDVQFDNKLSTNKSDETTDSFPAKKNSKPSTCNSSSSLSDLSSISDVPEAFDHILGDDEHLTQMDLIPDNYYLALSPKPNGEIESPTSTEEIMELNRVVQRRLVEQILQKKGKKISPSEERRRKKLIHQMKKQFAASLNENTSSNQSESSTSSKKRSKENNQLEKYQTRREKYIKQSLSTWRIKIIPYFDKVKTHNSTLRMWKRGLPPSVRGQVWRLSVGNETASVNRPLYNILKTQRLEEKTSKKSGPYYHPFLEVLECWVKFRPDIGYIQGMSYLVGMMLLNMESYEAFEMLSNLMTSKKYHFYRIFSMKRENMIIFSSTLKVLIREKLPELHTHFERLKITLEVFVIDWFMTLFSKSFPLDISTHFWDLYFLPCKGGELFLFKATLGILLFYFPRLIRLEYDECMQFLSHVSEVVTEKDKFELMKAIGLIKLSSKQLGKASKEAEKMRSVQAKKEAIWMQRNRKRMNSYNSKLRKEKKKNDKKLKVLEKKKKKNRGLVNNKDNSNQQKQENEISIMRRRIQSDKVHPSSSSSPPTISSSPKKKEKNKKIKKNIIQFKNVVNNLKKKKKKKEKKKKKKKKKKKNLDIDEFDEFDEKPTIAPTKKNKPLKSSPPSIDYEQRKKKKKKIENDSHKVSNNNNSQQKEDGEVKMSNIRNALSSHNKPNPNKNSEVEELKNSIKRRMKVTKTNNNSN